MEFKWFMIMISVTVLAMFSSVAASEYAKAEKQSKCLASYAMSDRSADEINQICR